MCYKKPGPRCTSHVRQELADADALLNYAIKKYGEKSAQSQAAYEAWIKLREAWDTTPGGQEELAAEIKKLEEKRDRLFSQGVSRSDRLMIDVEDSLGSLRWRAREGKDKRAKQMKAYKFHQRYAEGFRPKLDQEWGERHPCERSWEMPNGDTVSVFKHRNPRADYIRHAWVLRDNEPIAMLHFFAASPEYGDVPTLCDIEVSPFYRGEGISRSLVKEVSREYGQLHATGTYSISGHAALGDILPKVPWADVNVTTVEEYEFVDWENGRLISS